MTSSLLVIISTRSALQSWVREGFPQALQNGPLRAGVRMCSNPALIDHYRPEVGAAAVEFLLLDLGDAQLRPGYPRLLSQWHGDYPECTPLYLLSTHTDLEEARCYSRLTLIAKGEPVTEALLRDATALTTLLTTSVDNRVYVELRHALLASVSPATIVEPTTVFRLLERAPAVANSESYGCWNGKERRSMARILNMEAQREPRELLKAFRVLWAVRYRELGLPPGTVARRLGYEDASDCARKIGVGLELGMRDLNRLGCDQIIELYAQHLVRTIINGHQNAEARMLTLKAIGTRLRGLHVDLDGVA